MPITPTYPGVYIEEVPSGVRTIVGVATSITAFIGRALRGPVDTPVRIQSFADFERKFGGLWVKSALGYSVQQFFLNGGSDAIIVRVVQVEREENEKKNPVPLENRDPKKGATRSKLVIGSLKLVADSEGVWGDNLLAYADHEVSEELEDDDKENAFNLFIMDFKTKQTETFLNVSIDPDSPRFITNVLEQESFLVDVNQIDPPEELPPKTEGGNFEKPNEKNTQADEGSGSDGDAITPIDVMGKPSEKSGIYALEDADLFNLLCIPPLTRLEGGSTSGLIYQAAVKYCIDRRAICLVDPPDNMKTVTDMEAAVRKFGLGDFGKNAAIYFPSVIAPDPLKENRPVKFAASGAVAGIIARTDAQRGVWKAPAGLDASVNSISRLETKLTDDQNGRLNQLGVNCLREFGVAGNVSWGARTMRGADQLASEWKYLPVRRTALFIEESLFRGTQFAVFEPNDEPLWSQIRLNVGAFMQNLFRQGAFQGSTPNESYLVKCDKETTIQNDINRGIVNILVGFAPLKPAEFVVIKIQQMAGNIQT